MTNTDDAPEWTPGLLSQPARDWEPSFMSMSVESCQISGIRPDQVRTVEFRAPEGQGMAVTLHLDTGQVELGPGYTPDEAARVFWDAVQDIARKRAFGGPLAATIDQHLADGQRAEQQVKRLDEMAEAWAAQLPETVRTATVVDAVHMVTRPNGERP